MTWEVLSGNKFIVCKKLRSSVTRGVGQVGPLPMFQELNSSGFEKNKHEMLIGSGITLDILILR